MNRIAIFLVAVGALAAGLAFVVRFPADRAAGDSIAPPFVEHALGRYWSDPLWDDGRAEVNLYEATEVRYGVPRATEEAVLLFVKEDHRSDSFVKVDDPSRGDLPAIKMNWVAVVPTGIYTYRQMASIFLDRRTGRPFRETFASHEWCGSTFKDLVISPGRSTFRWTSYFEADDAGERGLDLPAGTLAADALPAVARALVAEAASGLEAGGPAEVRVALFPTLWSNRARPENVRPAEATIRLGEAARVEVPAGTVEARRVEAEEPAGRWVLYVERARPHRLLTLQKPDGSAWRLRKSFRVAYWSEHDVGDERLKEGAGLEP